MLDNADKYAWTDIGLVTAMQTFGKYCGLFGAAPQLTTMQRTNKLASSQEQLDDAD